MGRVVSVPIEKSGKERGLFKAGGGIYRVKAKTIENQLFFYTNKEPRVPKTYDYYRLVTETAQQVFPDIWLNEIRAAIDKG